ncbi:MAG: hypothetical protein CMN21_18085 [Rubinisphaera sp.]|nr:hypothetical protein [Rubinisphaera sp.]
MFFRRVAGVEAQRSPQNTHRVDDVIRRFPFEDGLCSRLLTAAPPRKILSGPPASGTYLRSDISQNVVKVSNPVTVKMSAKHQFKFLLNTKKLKKHDL